MLTEHIRLAEENHNLIYGFLHYYKLGDDFYGDAAIGLCKAAESFDESIGCSFASYAYKCMYNECGIVMRANKRKVQTISLETPIVDGENINLESILPSDSSNEQMESIPYIMWFIDKMCLLDLRILLYRLQGYSLRDIEKKIGYSHQQVSNRLYKIGEAYKKKKRLCTTNNTEDISECQNIKNEILTMLRG